MKKGPIRQYRQLRGGALPFLTFNDRQKMWPTDNLDSWRRVQEFIEKFPDDDRWLEWKRIANSLVRSLAEQRLDSSLRIGQSMSHIILSTLDHHQLGDEPRVTLEIHGAEKKVRLAYSTSNLWFNPPIEEVIVAESDSLVESKRMLRMLWLSTKSEIEVPDALKEA